ncbi:MAG: MerR family transcriptional regulator [Betaproteobacteria bacterium]
MTNEHDSTAADAGFYRSGAAARFAGLPVETLRVWERRYGVVRPQLSPRGQRLYSFAEVRRLALIKQLVDTGQPIGAIAALPTSDLIAMRDAVQALASPRGRTAVGVAATRQGRITLAGPSISTLRLDEAAAFGRLNIVGRCENVSDVAKLPGHMQSDVVVIELPTLNAESLDAVANAKTACGADWAIVLYRFAPNAAIRRLRDAGHQVVHATSDAVEIAAMCSALLHSPQTGLTNVTPDDDTIAPPQFDDHALAALAGASSSVYCECPRHLVELLRDLGSFERYSAECANRDPADSALHRDLQINAARARAMLEGALMRVAIAEGLPLPPIVATI